MPSTNWLPWGARILVVSLAFAGAVPLLQAQQPGEPRAVIAFRSPTMIRVLRLTNPACHITERSSHVQALPGDTLSAVLVREYGLVRGTCRGRTLFLNRSSLISIGYPVGIGCRQAL